ALPHAGKGDQAVHELTPRNDYHVRRVERHSPARWLIEFQRGWFPGLVRRKSKQIPAAGKRTRDRYGKPARARLACARYFGRRLWIGDVHNADSRTGETTNCYRLTRYCRKFQGVIISRIRVAVTQPDVV